MELAATSRVMSLRGSAPELIRTPPYNPEAEQRLLGALLINNASYLRISEFLEPEHFGNAMHSRIFAAIGRLIERGQLANPVTLKDLFDQDGALAEIGGAQYLRQLAEAGFIVIDTADYARIVHDLHLRRELITLGEDVVNDAFRQDLDDEPRDQIERAEKKLFDLATKGQADTGFRPLNAAITDAIYSAEAAFKRNPKTVGVATGFRDLDDKLGGLHPSDLIVLAGRPSMGKTALATNIAFNAARKYKSRQTSDGRKLAEDGAVVGFFSLEMSAEQLATRMLAEESGTSSDRIRRGAIAREDFDRFVIAAARLETVPLFVDDTPALTISGLRTRARRLMRQQGLGLIVVDYLQLLRPSNQTRSQDSRVQEISEITRGLKTLAKELNVPVLALSQLSRAVEQREDKRPLLSDLRESGSIEQDADVVMFIFRKEYYDTRNEPQPPKESDNDKQNREAKKRYDDEYEKWHQNLQQIHGKAEIIIAKQRHGPIGTVTLHFDAERTKFEDYAAPDYMPDVR